ncbi:MAG: hypothetical protein BWX87_00780 [Bacteroidetes bacterium ADurb.Bin123]|jgi:hypothetical protein|nr:MAG: hypothetical protein BWX87_00780 [Bacteroidetes bacterium ADurb.Bin123]
MKTRILMMTICFLAFSDLPGLAQDMGTGVPWGGLSPSEPLLLIENFQGFTFFHSDSTADMGNSNNSYDNDGETVIYGYKNDSVEVPILGSANGKITYLFKQCAFAPTWKTAYAFKNSVENTPNVSNGFVEISRNYSSDPPTIQGEFVVDLRQIEFVEVIQWTHSSCGGNKRGVMLEFSVDDGTTWDTLRYQPAQSAYASSFTKDVETREKTFNDIYCDPSAYGMTWEDGIWAGNVMLRFGVCNGQVPRIHDIKIYGTYSPPSAVQQVGQPQLGIRCFDRKIRISEPADVEVYSIAGTLVRKAANATMVHMGDLPDGIYLVTAIAGPLMQTKKVIIQ